MTRETDIPKTLFPRASARLRPGYYSGDKPNPTLAAFVSEQIAQRPYEPSTDAYSVEVFNTALESTRSTAIYGLHPYHQGKKPHDSIRQYIQHYTSPGDLVLDPMCGSGSSALAALLDGRKAIAIDLSPAATFVARGYCCPSDPVILQKAFAEVLRKAKPTTDMLYGTKCPSCRGPAEVQYVVWSERYECLRCARVVALAHCRTEEVEAGTHPGFERGQGSKKTVSICPLCNKQPISTRSKKHGMIPVEVSTQCLRKCSTGQTVRPLTDPTDPDYVAAVSPPARGEARWVPTEPFTLWAEKHDGLSSRGVRTVSDFFTRRNLLALAEIRHHMASIEDEPLRQSLLFVFTASLMSCSKKAQHLDEGGGYIPGNWHIPPMIKERNVPKSMSRVLSKALKGMEEIRATVQAPQCVLSTQSAEHLQEIQSNSVDYIFTDPPYGAAVQYGELNILWESWLGFGRGWLEEEIVVNGVRGKTEEEWMRRMTAVLCECYRVLKPGRAISICYHDASGGTWPVLLDAAAQAGFVSEQTDRALTIQMQQRTFNQSTSNEVTKRDLVVTFRKPSPAVLDADGAAIPGQEQQLPEGTFAEAVLGIIVSELTRQPGMTIDRIYDIVVSRLARLGRMQKHDFRGLLLQVAEPTSDERERWFLKEDGDRIDAAESIREDAAAQLLAKYIQQRVAQSHADGVHYSDLFEHYLFIVRGNSRPRRPLLDWLPDFFYKTEEGTWRVPADVEEEQLKAKARASGANRRIKRYAAILLAGVAIPKEKVPSTATIAEWIRHAKRSGLYEAGKLLYERGGVEFAKLSEEQQVEVDEDYQVCVRAIQRAAGGEATTAPKKRGRKKKTETGE